MKQLRAYNLIGLILLLLLAACQSEPAPPESSPGEIKKIETQTNIPENLESLEGATQVIPFNTQQILPPTSNTSELKDVPMPLMGAEVKRLGSNEHLQLTRDAGMILARYNGLLWSEIEPVEGERHWEFASKLDEALIKASEQGLHVILIVRSTPTWAQSEEGLPCGPINSDKLQSFAAFLSEAVNRYSAPPYNVKYWELGNEPDVDPKFVKRDSPYGCWGDENDPSYGGGSYGEMLKVAYPAIKAADPESQVLIGGLLLDCDPTHPPEGKDCKPANFLEGILKNGGGDYFDIVSFHGYSPYSKTSPQGELSMDKLFPSWEARGGVVLGKLNFIREVMAKYGEYKPVMHTEGSLICPAADKANCSDPPSDAFLQAQADYVVWLLVRNWAEGIVGTTWYQMDGPGWRFGGILDKDQQPKPVYYAFQFLTKELGETRFARKVQEYPELNGYEFISSEKKIWVLWSADGQSREIALPDKFKAIYDKLGNELFPNGNKIIVADPIYVEITP